MRYPIAIEIGGKKTAYGVVVPDLPGCFSAGDTMDEAIAQAEEAILLWLEEATEHGEELPKPSRVEDLRGKRGYKGWTWAVVDVDLSKLSDKAVRINITMPERVLKQVDEHAGKSGETRSGFLARAAIEAIRAAQ